MKLIYGPVPSWRLGRSLGIDLICSDEKICSFDCIYCQLGRTKKLSVNRNKFVSTSDLERELKVALDRVEFDVITFSGTGEPTLAKNLASAVKIVRKITDIPLAILTNSSLMFDSEVRNELLKFDIVIAKLDAHNSELFRRINRPSSELNFDYIIEGIRKFQYLFYDGKLCLQIMFINDNKKYAKEIAELARSLHPSEVQINTPLRQNPIKPLNPKEILDISNHFKGLNVRTIYESMKPDVKILDKEDVLKRRTVLL